MSRLLISFLLLCSVNYACAQTVKGAWYGRADVVVSGSASNYLTELILKQKGNDVEGIFGYYFKDSYQSFFIRGTYNPQTRLVNIKNIPLLFYGSSTRSGIECPMNFVGKLMVSKIKSSLTGNFYTEAKYKYTCPELTVNMTMDATENKDSALLNAVASKRFWQPQEEDIVINARDTNIHKEATVSAMPASRISGIENSAAATTPASQVQPPSPGNNAQLIEEFSKRNNIYEKDIIVHDDSILVSFYDNGDIDDDTISVFLNKKPILVKRGLSARALNIYIGLDSTTEVHELSMFADNLGKFPPNTALMVISDRQLRYEVYLSASLSQNSSVRLRRPRRQ